ncbi:MAG: Rne/Rng family ribonuclease [Candidatus Omnitrophica bacterium]|nr:Rne/Rng family ribonuclease [Candidatus Omnitrophota bacterium]MDD5488386.1 Rne/Rng family ribonuclease [Candidatus Omnitrophota bacterium]
MMARNRKHKEVQNVSREILINVGPVEKRVAVMAGNNLVDFFMERKGLEHYAGSIFKGKVKSILPGIEAAFVDIGMEKNGFLHVSDVLDKPSMLKEMLMDDSDGEKHESSEKRHKQHQKISDILKQGQEIMVQVVKEAIGTKGPRLTTYISIPGRYIVLTPFDKNIGISRRIPDREERKRIRGIIEKIGCLKDVGCIVRTVAEKRSEQELVNEAKYLVSLWEKIRSRAEKQSAPVTVYEEYGVVLRLLRDIFTDDVVRLVVDSKDEYSRIIKFLRAFMPSLRKKVKLYKGKTPMFTKYSLDRKIDQIFERKVELKNGGYLVIEQTEGVVVIDVNTGSYVGKKSLEETAFRTNIEAAREIPKQLLLRDMGGIIIIDFIDMERKDHRDELFRILQENLKEDKARISLRAISQFGIVEMTRQRMRKSLEGSSHVECPYCGGKGMIKSVETIAIETARHIDQVLSKSTKHRKRLLVTVHPDIHEALISDQAVMLGDIQRKYRCQIDIKEDRGLHIEETIIEEN